MPTVAKKSCGSKARPHIFWKMQFYVVNHDKKYFGYKNAKDVFRKVQVRAREVASRASQFFLHSRRVECGRFLRRVLALHAFFFGNQSVS